MGREIRRVPKGWRHPKQENSEYYQPLYDKDFETKAKEWKDEFLSWENGTHEYSERFRSEYEFWEWDNDPPDRKYYREKFTEEPMCYQVYENVSEGTPVSPVFETEAEIMAWLISQGHSRKASEEFVKYKYAPTMVISLSQNNENSEKEIKMNIDTYDFERDGE